MVQWVSWSYMQNKINKHLFQIPMICIYPSSTFTNFFGEGEGWKLQQPNLSLHLCLALFRLQTQIVENVNEISSEFHLNTFISYEIWYWTTSKVQQRIFISSIFTNLFVILVGHELLSGQGNNLPTSFLDDDSVGPKVLLEDRELWEKFHGLTNEMIVTKSGR